MTDQAHREMLVATMAQIIDPEIVRQMARPGPAWVNRTTLAREKAEAILDALTTGPVFEAMVGRVMLIIAYREGVPREEIGQWVEDEMRDNLRIALGATG